MRKYLVALFVSIISFYTIATFLSNRKIRPTSILVEVDVRVQENDIFYVYYLDEDQKQWSDNFSKYQRIKGSDKEQKITFELPVEKPIQKIRLDIGANKQQGPIKVKSITLKSEIGQNVFSDSIPELFDLNAYAVYKNGYYYPKEVSGRYDPFLVSKEQVSNTLERLRQPGPLFSKRIVSLLALIFSLAIGTFAILTYNKIHSDFFIISFLLIITAPVLTIFLGMKPSNSDLEKRELAKMPELSFTSEFPKEFETYYNDNFGLRNAIIQLSSEIKINVFKSSPKPELVQFGKNEFLFYNSLDDEIFNSYTNQNLLEKPDLEKYYQKIKKRKEDLKEKEIDYIVGFWPNKHTIYPEMLPISMSSQIKGDYSLADQITDFFNKTNLAFFDVRQDVINAKTDNFIYRKFDTHWNSDGAYAAYRAFCKQTTDMIELEPYSKKDFDIKYNDGLSGDLTKQMGVESIIGYRENVPTYKFKNQDKNHELASASGYPKGSIVTKNQNAPKNQKALVFRDSYTSQMIQFISLHFKEVIYVSDIYDKKLIENIKPDVVISCRVERYMLSM